MAADNQQSNTVNDCVHPNTVDVGGFETCDTCGLQFERAYSEQDVRVFDHDQTKRRMRQPVHRKVGYRTTVGNKKDLKTMKITIKQKIFFSRINKIQKSNTNSIERNMNKEITKILNCCNLLNFQEHVTNDVVELFREAIENGLARGRSINGTIGACIFAVCKFYKKPISIQEIVDIVNETRKMIMGIYTDAIFKLSVGNVSGSVDPKHYITKYGNEIRLTVTDIENCKKFFDFLKKRHYSTDGRDPNGVAVSIIYFMGSINAIKSTNITMKLTQKKLAKLGGTTEVTVRTRLKEFKKLTEKTKFMKSRKVITSS
jgi:transcription initiation factor TFIIB